MIFTAPPPIYRVYEADSSELKTLVSTLLDAYGAVGKLDTLLVYQAISVIVMVTTLVGYRRGIHHWMNKPDIVIKALRS